MNISIFGMGYVGLVSAACLAQAGHNVVGVDPNDYKVEMINDAVPPMVEHGMDDLIEANVTAGRLRATTCSRTAVEQSDVGFVCVGTPSRPNGSLDLQFLERVCAEIGSAIADRTTHFTVIIRSTMLPGTTEDILLPTLEHASGKRAGTDFDICVNPEFLREASAVHDFNHPSRVVVGADSPQVIELVRDIVHKNEAPLLEVPIRVAEMIKYVDNSWHALKVAFANEVGRVTKAFDLDSHDVMDLFCTDQSLNLSDKYLTPGMAFGGSCLPKDVRALTHKARSMDINLPVLDHLMDSNRVHLDWARDQVLAHPSQNVSILGLSFKAGTDDLREAPMVDLAEQLLGKGKNIRIFDDHVSVAHLTGSNQRYITSRLSHIERLLVDFPEALNHGDVIVVGNQNPIFAELDRLIRPEQVVIDMVRVVANPTAIEHYEGLLW